ncbi:FG-GAP repeat protein [bacterium]|nr:FG-GAP repeat protein [bacterium]
MRFTIFLITITLFTFTANIHAQSETKITADDAEAGDCFGISVSISGDYAVVGAAFDDDDGRSSGSAYIFVRDSADWTEQAKLTAHDAVEGDRFGTSVSISGDYAVVGTPPYAEDSGSAYIFVRDGENWTELTKLTADDPAAYDRFGYSVSIDGDYAAVGAWNSRAYIFVRDGDDWTQQAELTDGNEDWGDGFGWSVSISGDYVVIGTRNDLQSLPNYGFAYIFVREGENWTEQAKLTSDDPAEYDGFGMSVSISGDYAVVGALGDDYEGSAYIFVRDGTDWTQQTKLTADDAMQGDDFGGSVSISGDYAVIGATNDDDAGYNSGSAYIFVRDGEDWTQQVKRPQMMQRERTFLVVQFPSVVTMLLLVVLVTMGVLLTFTTWEITTSNGAEIWLIFLLILVLFQRILIHSTAQSVSVSI